jgi:hypothetical protein
MEPKSAAQELPALYRALLDRVAQFEASGKRGLANRIRADATRIYSKAWDDRARRDLEALLRRNSVELATRPATRRDRRRGVIRTA